MTGQRAAQGADRLKTNRWWEKWKSCSRSAKPAHPGVMCTPKPKRTFGRDSGPATTQN